MSLQEQVSGWEETEEYKGVCIMLSSLSGFPALLCSFPAHYQQDEVVTQSQELLGSLYAPQREQESREAPLSSFNQSRALMKNLKLFFSCWTGITKRKTGRKNEGADFDLKETYLTSAADSQSPSIRKHWWRRAFLDFITDLPKMFLSLLDVMSPPTIQ